VFRGRYWRVVADGNRLTFRVTDHAHETLVAVEGEVDLASAHELVDAVARLRGRVVVDLAQVGYLDSSGIHALDQAQRKLEGDGGTLVLRRPQETVARVLELTGFQILVEE
jgi:anti-anti-sigma factor